MPSNNGTNSADDQFDDLIFETELSDEAYEELASLEGAAVIGISFWDSSLADELEELPPSDEERVVIDLDLYLEDMTLLELYGVMLFPGVDAEPMMGLKVLEQALIDLVDSEGELSEVAQTEDGNLALVFTAEDEIELIITVSAWAVSEWEELPED